MGFSVSGSVAIVFVGLLLAFGMWHTAATNSFERVDEARSDRADAALDEKNTAIVIDATDYDAVNETLRVTATNDGSTSLSLAGSDLLIDNEYQSGWYRGGTIDGVALETDLWLPGETVSTTLNVACPEQIKLVTESGVAATATTSTCPTPTPTATIASLSGGQSEVSIHG